MPYKSDAQRRYFHWAQSQGKIPKKTVDEYDEASKGKNLPEHVVPKRKEMKKYTKKADLMFKLGFLKTALDPFETAALEEEEKKSRGNRL